MKVMNVSHVKNCLKDDYDECIKEIFLIRYQRRDQISTLMKQKVLRFCKIY